MEATRGLGEWDLGLSPLYSWHSDTSDLSFSYFTSPLWCTWKVYSVTIKTALFASGVYEIKAVKL